MPREDLVTILEGPIGDGGRGGIYKDKPKLVGLLC